MRLPILLAAAAAAAVLAIAPAGAATMPKMGPAGVPVSRAPFDQQFLDMMAAHHQMAVDMAKMALDSARHAKLKALARGIIAAQEREIRQFAALRKRWYGSATFKQYRMDEMMTQMMGMGGMDEMHAMMGLPRFDEAFLTSMIPHHAGAITMSNWLLLSGTHARLKQMCRKIIRDQSKEVGDMIAMRKAWYGA